MKEVAWTEINKKNYLRTSMTEEKLLNLVLWSTEDKVHENIDCNNIISDLLKWR